MIYHITIPTSITMDRNFHINGITALAVGSLTLIAIYLVTVGPAFTATVIPTERFMRCSWGKTDNNSNVQAVTGRSAFTLDRDCSGWQSNEDYLIEFEGKEGHANRIISRFKSWES